MAADPKKRQKKLAKKAAKRKEKKHALARGQSAGLPERFRAATAYPVLHCHMTHSLEEEGIGWVVLSRSLPGGQVAVAAFLVDRYCLGVKNVIAQVISGAAYDGEYTQKFRTGMPGRQAPLAEARKFLEEAVAYARDLGLPPHPLYAKAMLLFGDVNPADSDATFEFGKDGKPYFINGPHDSPERCRQIVAILNNTVGPGNFHFTMLVPPGVPAGSADEFLDDYDDEDFDDYDDEEDEPGWGSRR